MERKIKRKSYFNVKMYILLDILEMEDIMENIIYPFLDPSTIGSLWAMNKSMNQKMQSMLDKETRIQACRCNICDETSTLKPISRPARWLIHQKNIQLFCPWFYGILNGIPPDGEVVPFQIST